jgi:hypothetical protein
MNIDVRVAFTIIKRTYIRIASVTGMKRGSCTASTTGSRTGVFIASAIGMERCLYIHRQTIGMKTETISQCYAPDDRGVYRQPYSHDNMGIYKKCDRHECDTRTGVYITSAV